ncbi:MAG: penicillin-binding protein 1B [Gammaproteobacteria bacterium]|nr:MAG: penicillin-binding protein 1B [Gammaproteobacteria bacterium]
MAKKTKKKTRGSSQGSGRLRFWITRLGLSTLVMVVGYAGWLDMTLRAKFERNPWDFPARIYARPLEIYPGMRLTSTEFKAELQAAGYTHSADVRRPGRFRASGNRFQVRTRAFRFWDGTEPPRSLALEFKGDEMVAVTDHGKPVALARLEPALIGRILPTHHEDRIRVRLDEVPAALIRGLVAVEDRAFYAHHGVALRSIARALLANIQAGGTVQGVSALTQQLTKNLFLSPERTLWRKFNEAALALVMEWRYSKEEILEGYLNEIYLGQSGGRAIHGFGLAAHHYFGRPLEELGLHEMALLVALVQGASYNNPRRHPQRALERRNLVLRVMAEQGAVAPERAEAAARQRLGVIPQPPKANSPYPAFMDVVRRQLGRNYRDQDLRAEGLRVFTTLNPTAQEQAEVSLSTITKRLNRPELQGAVVVTNPQTGEILAVVGDRRSRRVGFNRATDAVRPIGSLVKPAIYLAALERSRDYTLATGLRDQPVHVSDRSGKSWSPKNYDGQAHGRVPLVSALAHSYNLATVNLGLKLGLRRVIDTIHRLGVEKEIPAYPSVLLGSLALSPIGVAQMYQTLAAGGFNVPLRAIREVTAGDGGPLKRYEMKVKQVAKPEAVFVLNRALHEVTLSGTARSADVVSQAGVRLAGKTVTTDEMRESWGAGFGADRLAVVWLGRDDNGPTGLSGATGALRVWNDLMKRIRPRSLDFAPPAGVEWRWTHIEKPATTDANCRDAVPLPFVAGSAPPYVPCVTARAVSTSASEAG